MILVLISQQRCPLISGAPAACFIFLVVFPLSSSASTDPRRAAAHRHRRGPQPQRKGVCVTGDGSGKPSGLSKHVVGHFSFVVVLIPAFDTLLRPAGHQTLWGLGGGVQVARSASQLAARSDVELVLASLGQSFHSFFTHTKCFIFSAKGTDEIQTKKTKKKTFVIWSTSKTHTSLVKMHKLELQWQKIVKTHNWRVSI